MDDVLRVGSRLGGRTAVSVAGAVLCKHFVRYRKIAVWASLGVRAGCVVERGDNSTWP